jgi:regulator of protease activity HflC (stomatin/prohibitin superfamily)
MTPIVDKKALCVEGFAVVLTIVLITALPSVFFMVFQYYNAPIVSAIILFSGMLMITGFTMISPNEAKVLTFFGKYVGTIHGHQGFLWTLPFTLKDTVSLKVINMSTPVLKVNDLRGNPVELACVIVWRVVDAAQAKYNVENYEVFIKNQSEVVLRSIASQHPYDGSDDVVSLRAHAPVISEMLAKTLQEKVSVAGIHIEDVRLSHLAYAPEIATAMLKRQQAVASLEAREYLVKNALSIVDDVVEHFSQGASKLGFSDEKKADLVNNLLITLVSSNDAEPVLNLTTR